MGRLPHRSLSSVLTATVLTAVAIAQPVLFLKQAALAQTPDAANQIEFMPENGADGAADSIPEASESQVITAPQGSFGRGGRAAVPSSAPISPSPATEQSTDDPIATSTFTSQQSATPNSDTGSGGASLGAAPANTVPASAAATNDVPVAEPPASITPATPTVSQAIPQPSAVPSQDAPTAVPPLGDSAPYNYSAPNSAVTDSAVSEPVDSETLPAIPIPAQPVSPQPAPNLAADAPSQPDIPTSYDYQRPSENRPSSPTFVANGQLPEGTIIPMATFRDTKFTQGQQLQVNLSVTQDVTDSQGRTIVPAGSTVWGRFEPLMQESTEMVGSFERTRERMVGSHFIAERIDIQSASHAISGQTNRIPAGIDPDAEVDRVALRNAGFGALGGIALGVLTGGVALPLIAIGGAGGAMAGTVSISNVVAIDGDTILELTLDQPFISN